MLLLNEHTEKVNTVPEQFDAKTYEATRAQLVEIAHRYDHKRRQKHRPCLMALRRSDIRHLVGYRQGADRDLLHVYACHLLTLSNPQKRIIGIYQAWAPWMPMAEIKREAEQIVSRAPRRWSAAKLGELLALTENERTACRITTIRSIDGPTSAERKRLRERTRRRESRKAAGAVPRSEYLAGSKERQKPWIQLGISRATFFRRGLHVAPIEWRAAA